MTEGLQPSMRKGLMQDIIDMTCAMQERAAADGLWDEIGALQLQRERLVREFFAVPVTAEESVWIAHALEQVIRMDQDIESKCRAEMGAVSAQIQGLARGRDASAAYQSLGE